MTVRQWRRRVAPPPGFARAMDLPPLRAHLLYNRGITRPDAAASYLESDSSLLNDALLLPDMETAVARLRRALSAGEVIGIFGDFDTDGVTATAILTLALRELGSEPVPYLPSRVSEGHGLNDGAVRSLRSRAVSLMVTVDCGSSSVHELQLARSLGIESIVTDHHTMPETLPDIVAVVNPRRSDSRFPYQGLTGAGLAYKLAEALYGALGQPMPDHLLELAALGTVADVGPLTGENRYIVKHGLDRIRRTRHPGLTALIAKSGVTAETLDTESLSYRLIPRLNAAGRLSHAQMSLDLLLAPTPEEADAIAEQLDLQNDERRRLTAEAVAEAFEQVERNGGQTPPLMFVQHEGWAPGILGLVAGRLSEANYRPAVAVSVGETESRGSARSIPEFDIIDALRRSDGLFDRFGGHPEAAGFTLPSERLPQLKRELIAHAERQLAGTTLAPSIVVDCEISPAALDQGTLDFIESMAPFGEANPPPLFVTRDARVVEARRVGSQGDHLKMRLAHSGRSWDAIAFDQGSRAVERGSRIDVVYTPGVDDWQGRQRLQLRVLDFRETRLGAARRA